MKFLAALLALVLAAPVLLGIARHVTFEGLGARIASLPALLAAEHGDVSTFIPEFWVRTLLAKLRHAHIFGQPLIANRNYEGIIRQAGDTVTINSVGEVTIKDYNRNAGIDAPERLTTAQRQLLIDQEKYFNFAVDDVDAAQAAGDLLSGGMESAAFGLSDVSDQFLASHYTDAAAGNQVGTDADPVAITKPEHAYFWLNRLGLKLDNAKVVSNGRFAAVPNWFASLLTLDKRFTSVADSGSSAALLNGEVGQAAGFRILKTHNAPHVPADAGPPEIVEHDVVIAGVPMALSFAEQINKTEAYRPEGGFEDAIKGLHVYGGKLVYAEAWAVGRFVDGVGDVPPA